MKVRVALEISLETLYVMSQETLTSASMYSQAFLAFSILVCSAYQDLSVESQTHFQVMHNYPHETSLVVA
jgi:hypothetical protein